MSTGTQSDMFNRLKSLLPNGWFQEPTPVLDSILNGIAWALSFCYSLIAYTYIQTRIKTATDYFLDLISNDYFGTRLLRHNGQTDAQFRAQILANLLPQKTTRLAVKNALTILTGRVPKVIELTKPMDCGVYGGPYCGYGLAGAYGSLIVNQTGFVVAYRALSTGSSPYGYVPTDAEMYALVNSARPSCYNIWMAISN